MTDRSRRSTETGTGVAPGAPGVPSAGGTVGAVEVATPTQLDAPQQATPTEITARTERSSGEAARTGMTRERAKRSNPIRVISMKDATGPRKQRTDERRAVQVQLRSIAEVRRRHDTPVGLGHLAPPRDPRQARKRRLVDNVIWGCVAIMLACGIMLAIWLVAGR